MNPRLRELIERYHAKRKMAAALLTGKSTTTSRRWSERGFADYRIYSETKFGRTDYAYGGMRKVGNVLPEFKRRAIFAQDDGHNYGWYTNPYGESYTNGAGLCWGVVFQLPSRHRQLHFIAGFVVGGEDYQTIDGSTVFREQEGWHYRDADTAWECDACVEAARHADRMAMTYAEDEKQFQWEEDEKQKEQEDEDDDN